MQNIAAYNRFLRKLIREYRLVKYKLAYMHGSFRDKDIHGIDVNSESRFFFDNTTKTELVNLYNQYFQKHFHEELKAAQNICEHKFDFLSHPVQHGDEVDWSLDPISQKRWDKGFSFDIIYRGPDRLGDIKLPWELNKHQYFFTLGKIYWMTGNDAFCKEIISQIASWIDKNPIHRGINWISSLEIGMRIISWIMAYPFIVEKIEKGFRNAFLSSLYHQLTFVEQNLSLVKFANTHLIGEASSLIMGGLFLKSKKSSRWITKGLKILSIEISKQVSADGIHREQSLNYQRFFLDYYYLILILLRLNKIEYPRMLDCIVEKMTEFILNSLKPDGLPPPFSDADDARGIYVKQDCVNDYYGILSLGAVLFRRGDFKYVARNLSQEIIWLLGNEGVHSYRQIKPIRPQKTSISYKHGGYYIMKGAWTSHPSYLIFDCGPLGYGLAGHGHADALSFQLYYNGFNYLTDPGTYSYNIDYDWRNYFRSTPAHNTISVDGLDQSEIKDRMAWKTSAKAQCNMWLTSEWFDMVDGEHKGYKRLEDPVLHRRVIFFNKNDFWIIFDFLKCNSEHIFDYYLHLGLNCYLDLDHNNNRISLTSPENRTITISFIENPNTDLELRAYRGDEKTRLGWLSEKYGSKVPTSTIRARKCGRGDTNFVTSINSATNNYDVIIHRNDCDLIAFSICNTETKIAETLFYSLHSPTAFDVDNIFFNGSLFYIRRNRSRPLLLYAKDFYEVDVSNNIAIHSDKIIHECTISEYPRGYNP